MTRSIRHRGTFPEKPKSYGYSAERSPLSIWRHDRKKVELLVFAGIHGEEPDTTMLLSRALRSTDRLSPSCAVVLCANPDGLRLGTRGNANGVDLNRNFPSANWQPDPVLHQWQVDAAREVELSPGPAPASEPEVQALIRLVEDLEPACVVSVHSPLGLIDDPDSHPIGAALAARSGLPREVIPNEHTPGSFGSWARDIGLASVTYELPNQTVWDMLPTHLPVLLALLEEGIGLAPR
ncbi:MAG: murein tripeptide amidase MpaA [Pseudomonadales bacterium]